MSDTLYALLAEICDAIRNEVEEATDAGFPPKPTDWIEIRLKHAIGPLAAVESVVKILDGRRQSYPHIDGTVKECDGLIPGHVIREAIAAALSQDAEETKCTQ